MDTRFEGGWSFSDRACFLLLFDELRVPLVRLRPPTAQCTTTYIVLSDGRWIKGFAEYLAIFSRREASSVVQSQLAKHGKLEPRRCVCRTQQHWFEIAEYCNGMDSVRLSVTQSSLEVLSKQISFFMCREAIFAQRSVWRVYWKFYTCTGCFFALVFSRVERGPDPLVLSPMIVNWLLNPSARFGAGKFRPTFSTQDTFEVQILTEMYDKTWVYRRIKAEFRVFLVDFVPFLKLSYWSRSHRRHDQETTWLAAFPHILF